MTQQPDWKAEREAIRARLGAALSDEHVCTTQQPDGTCKREDTQELISAEDLRRLLAHSEEDERELAYLKEVLDDKRRLTRELDIALHGEEGAAKRRLLCDLVGPAQALRATLALRDQRISELTEQNVRLIHDRDVLIEAASKDDAELAALRRANEEAQAVLVTCHSAIKSLPTDALGQDSEIGHYYRDELLAKIEAARQSREGAK